MLYSRCVTDDLISESFVQDQRFLKYRSLILRSIAASFALVSSNSPKQMNGSTNSEKALFESLINQLEDHHEQVLKDTNSYKPLDSPIQGPDRSRLSLYVDHGQVILATLKGLLNLYSHQTIDVLEKAWQMYESKVQKIISKPIPEQLVKEEFLEDILNVTEVCNNFLGQSNCFY